MIQSNLSTSTQTLSCLKLKEEISINIIVSLLNAKRIKHPTIVAFQHKVNCLIGYKHDI